MDNGWKEYTYKEQIAVIKECIKDCREELDKIEGLIESGKIESFEDCFPNWSFSTDKKHGQPSTFFIQTSIAVAGTCKKGAHITNYFESEEYQKWAYRVGGSKYEEAKKSVTNN